MQQQQLQHKTSPIAETHVNVVRTFRLSTMYCLTRKTAHCPHPLFSVLSDVSSVAGAAVVHNCFL